MLRMSASPEEYCFVWPLGHPGMKLNYDVLTFLMKFLHQAEILALSMTCRTLLAAGISHLVNVGAIIDDRRYPSFILYMKGNSGVAHHHLRILKIDIGRHCLRKDWADEFVDLMGRLPSLRSLTLVHSEDLLRWDPVRLIQAIAKVAALKELTLSDAGPFAHQLAKQLRASLAKLTLNFVGPGHLDPSPWVARCQDTLEEMYLSLCDMPDATMTFPRLHTLELEMCCRGRGICTNEMFRLFPNLQRLTITTIKKDWPQDYSVADTARTRNLQTRPDELWSNLKEIVSDVLSLYSLAISSRAHRLVIYQPVTGDNITRMMTTLDELRPRCLIFRTALREFDFRRLPSSLPRSLELTHLSITIDPTDCNLRMCEFVDTLIQILRLFPVDYLDIRVRVWFNSRKPYGTWDLSMFLDDIDHSKIAKRVACLDRSPKFLAIDIVESVAYYHAVSLSDGSDSFEVLGGYGAQQIMRAESLRPLIWG